MKSQSSITYEQIVFVMYNSRYHIGMCVIRQSISLDMLTYIILIWGS